MAARKNNPRYDPTNGGVPLGASDVPEGYANLADLDLAGYEELSRLISSVPSLPAAPQAPSVYDITRDTVRARTDFSQDLYELDRQYAPLQADLQMDIAEQMQPRMEALRSSDRAATLQDSMDLLPGASRTVINMDPRLAQTYRGVSREASELMRNFGELTPEMQGQLQEQAMYQHDGRGTLGSSAMLMDELEASLQTQFALQDQALEASQLSATIGQGFFPSTFAAAGLNEGASANVNASLGLGSTALNAYDPFDSDVASVYGDQTGLLANNYNTLANYQSSIYGSALSGAGNLLDFSSGLYSLQYSADLSRELGDQNAQTALWTTLIDGLTPF